MGQSEPPHSILPGQRDWPQGNFRGGTAWGRHLPLLRATARQKPTPNVMRSPSSCFHLQSIHRLQALWDTACPLLSIYAAELCCQLHLHHTITNFHDLQRASEELGATTTPSVCVQASVIWMIEVGKAFLKLRSWRSLPFLSVLTPEGTAADLSSLFQCLLIHLY